MPKSLFKVRTAPPNGAVPLSDPFVFAVPFFFLSSTLSLVFFAPSAEAQSLFEDAPEHLELSVAGGVRFEDNLVVDSLDVSSAQSDLAAVTKLDLGYDRDEAWRKYDVRAGYALDDRRYLDEQDFNLQLHYGYLDVSRDVSGLTAGAVVDATYARVGGRSLLTKQSVGGYLTDLVTERLYLRGDLALDTTQIDGSPGRDSNGQTLDGSAFYFLDGASEYLTAKLRYKQEQADDSVFDYQAQRLGLGYVKRLSVPEEMPVRVRGDWRYEVRRYDEFNPALGVTRRDYRNRWRVRLDAPVTDVVSVEMKLEHRRYNSNNPALDFNDNRVEFLIDVQLL